MDPKTRQYHVVDSILPSTNYSVDQFLSEFLQHSNFKVDNCDVFLSYSWFIVLIALYFINL